MKTALILLFTLMISTLCLGGGSIGWADVVKRLTPEAPDLLKVINDAFDVARSGSALRLGPHSLDVEEGRAEVGTRVPPYDFNCKPKGQPGPYTLRVEISDWDGGWHFTIRKLPKPVPLEHPSTP